MKNACGEAVVPLATFENADEPAALNAERGSNMSCYRRARCRHAT